MNAPLLRIAEGSSGGLVSSHTGRYAALLSPALSYAGGGAEQLSSLGGALKVHQRPR